MPNPSGALKLHKNFQFTEIGPKEEHTPGVAWLTVMMGGILLAGNVAELGGVPLAAKEWTAWLLAGVVLVHGVSMGWRWGNEDVGLRLPRWPIIAAVFVIWTGYAWWVDDTTPWLSRDAFILAGEGWLLCWVVAATPGTRALSWAWLMVVVAGASLAVMSAIGCQVTQNSLWLPAGRKLPAEWLGRWSGTLPLPGAFGALMLLAGPPLLVLACEKRIPVTWRILCGSGGLFMLLGAAFSFSLGPWLGVALVLGLLPWVVTQNKAVRLAGWLASVLAIIGWADFLYRVKLPGGSWLAALESGEPTFGATWQVIKYTWSSDPWMAGHGASFTDLAHSAGVSGPAGGWSYGFSDWSELAAIWGVLGLGLAGVIFGGLLLAAWVGWARLPRVFATEHGAGVQNYTPEAKVLLAATLMGLSAFVVTMLATRALNVPAVVFALAIMAGVLARNVPQRGGVLRLESAVRCSLCLVLASFVAVLLIWKVALMTGMHEKLAEAQSLVAEADRQPDAELLVRARADLHEVVVADPGNVPAYINLAWLELAQARLQPEQAELCGNQAEYNALRASNLAPRAPEPWVIRALACWLVNRPRDAEAYLNHALELAPKDPAVQYYAAALLLSDARQSAMPPGMRELPPRYVAPASWPPLMGLPAESEPRHPRP